MKNIVAPTFRSARAELKLSATTLPSRSVCLRLGFAKKGVHGAL
jgi:hypothetical protein